MKETLIKQMVIIRAIAALEIVITRVMTPTFSVTCVVLEVTSCLSATITGIEGLNSHETSRTFSAGHDR